MITDIFSHRFITHTVQLTTDCQMVIKCQRMRLYRVDRVSRLHAVTSNIWSPVKIL